MMSHGEGWWGFSCLIPVGSRYKSYRGVLGKSCSCVGLIRGTCPHLPPVLQLHLPSDTDMPDTLFLSAKIPSTFIIIPEMTTCWDY